MYLKSVKCSNLFITYLLSYSFYCFYLIGQISLFNLGRKIVFPMMLITLLSPFLFLIFVKNSKLFQKISLNDYIKQKENTKYFIIQKILIIVYLLLSNIFVFFYAIYFESVYFYNSLNIIIIAILFLVPIILFSKNIIKSTYNIFPLNIILYIMFFYLFFTNQKEIIYFNLLGEYLTNYNDLLKLIIFIIPTIFEPFLFFYLLDLSNQEIKIKKIILPIILVSLSGCLSYFQVGNQFGILLNKIELPFFQLWRNIYINEYIENLDTINIIFYIISSIIRILVSISLIYKLLNVKNKILPIILGIISLIVAIYFCYNLVIYKQIYLSIITISSCILILSSIFTIKYIIGANKYEKRIN